jgi:phage gp29-like protein
MAMTPTLLDRWGRAVERSTLKDEVAGPTITGIRSPITGYPADGLNPVRLAAILRAADSGDPVQFLELAETIEERDLHYLGVLGTRRRSVSQISITVEPASDATEDVEKADRIRDWLKRDELAEELFDILDCIGKGYSFTEIMWDTSGGQWQPLRLEQRDPRWFRFARHDLATPMKLDAGGQELPLDPFKFIFATIKAKSGLALRSGLARAAAWAWMFKAYTQRDWAIFTQTYGQPLRLGKYATGASEDDKDTLFRAVANIAGDCAAIIPESMMIEFIENKSIGASSDLYLKRCDWLDQQVSKAVLGNTATTDAIAGGHAVGRVHRQVQEDIERADAMALAAILNRDLIRPWMDLEYGPQQRYPRLKIAHPETEDLSALATSLGTLVPLGLRISQSAVRDRFGFAEPKAGEELLQIAPPAPPAMGAPGSDRAIKRFSGDFKRVEGQTAPTSALNAEEAPAAKNRGGSVPPDMIDRLAADTEAAMGEMMDQIEAMMSTAITLPELREMLLAGFPDLDASNLSAVLAMGLQAAHLAGRVAVEEDAG